MVLPKKMRLHGIDSTIQEAKKNYEHMLENYGPDHPRTVILEGFISGLKEARRWIA